MRFLALAGLTVIGELPFEDRTTQAALIAALKLRLKVPLRPDGHSDDRHQFYGDDFYRSSIITNVTNLGELNSHYDSFLKANKTDNGLGIAEKFVGFDILQVMKSYDPSNLVRPIFLMRDPRDIFISAKEFNKRRGKPGFGDSGNDQALFSAICNFLLWQKRHASRFRALICYYEDLMVKRSQTILDLLRHIGLSGTSKEFVDGMLIRLADIKGAQSHMTSETAEKSIARWQQPEYAALLPVFGKYDMQLNELGYL
jgi:hypothetical protein